MAPPWTADGARDRIGDIVEVARVQCRDADAARLQRVDGEAFAQGDHLVPRQTRIGEDSSLLQDEAEILTANLLPEAVHELPPHEADAVAHADDLFSPQDAHVGGFQYRRDDPRAVGRGVRIIRTDHALQLAQHPRRLVFVRGDDAQGPDAFAVQGEGLREGVGHEQEGHRFGKPANHLRVLVDPFPETLVREIEVRYQPARRSELDDFSPLLVAYVDPRGVVAARVEEDDRAFRGFAEKGHHFIELDSVGLRIVVGVHFDPEARLLEQRPVIVVARIGKIDRRVGGEALDEIRAHPEGSRPSHALNRRDPALDCGGVICPEQECLDGAHVLRDAVHGQVGTREAALGERLVSQSHALQERNFPAVVVIDAHAQVDLVQIGIGDEGLCHPENRIPGGHLQVGEQAFFLLEVHAERS